MTPDERSAAESGDLDLTEDGALGGRLRLRQPRRGHRFGHDAVLLAAATAAQPGERVVEFGAGVGLAGLALAWRVPGAQVTLIEIDPRLAALAEDNARLNGLADRVRTVALDVAARPRAFAAQGLAPAAADRVMMNPPYNDPVRHHVSPDPGRRAAHAGGAETLAVWCRVAARLLAPGGGLTLIWRADALADVLAALAGRFGGLTLLPVHPRPDAAAIRILVGTVKGSRAPLVLRPGLILNDDSGRPTPTAEAILRTGAPLPLG